MKELQEFLKETSGEKPKRGQTGQSTEWLAFCEFELVSGKVCVCDPAFAPPSQGMEVAVRLSPGEYRVEARGIAYGSDKRTAALRCVQAGSNEFELGDVIGEVGVDTGRIGFCDEKVFSAAARKLDEDAFMDLLDNMEAGAAILELEPGAAFPVVDSGFGDGSYPVRELRRGGELVGFELSLIAEDEAYQFEADFAGKPAAEQNDESGVVAGKFLKEMLAKAKERKTGDRAADKAVFKAVLDEMVNDQERELLRQVEEFREHLVAQRQSAPVTRTVTRPAPIQVLEKAEVNLRRTMLETRGYGLQGVHEFSGIPGFSLVLFTHMENGTIATISCGKELTTELAAEYPDGQAFYVRDTPPAPGLTPPPWATYRYEPGRSVPELVAIFEAHRPSSHRKTSGAEAAAALAEDFHRIQTWRLERGGWNRDEVQAQLGIKTPAGREEEISDACLNIREKWLFAWLKEKDPNRAEKLLRMLVIVHDELNSSVLFFLWLMGGGSPKVRPKEFEGMSAREAFRRGNEAHGQPLRLMAQKADAYGADYYEPR